MESRNKFNLRVYGVLIDSGRLLVTDEMRGGFPMTKLPGGGLEFGEGLEACLVREFQEEIGIDVEVQDFFYVNEFYQESRFNPNDQLLSFYYSVETPEIERITTNENFVPLKEDGQVFRWVNIPELKATDFTFPIDQIVIKKLIDQQKG